MTNNKVEKWKLVLYIRGDIESKIKNEETRKRK